MGDGYKGYKDIKRIIYFYHNNSQKAISQHFKRALFKLNQLKHKQFLVTIILRFRGLRN